MFGNLDTKGRGGGEESGKKGGLLINLNSENGKRGKEGETDEI